METKLISITPNAERIIGYCARVSNPDNQNNPDVSNLLKYCIKHNHWSIFEMANMTIEIETSRGIAAQILRHKSFSFQEFSQRYAKVVKFEGIHPRRQDEKNRQNSIDDLPKETIDWFNDEYEKIKNNALEKYNKALELGIAKECARFLLPLSATTRIYMNGSIRSWIHYLQVRLDASTQKEHREIAEGIRGIFSQELPIISSVLWG